MLLRRDSGNRNPSSAVTAFKPRQVLLAEQNSKAGQAAAMTTTTEYEKRTQNLKQEQRSLLLYSVLRFLERGGFAKALKRLLSEAQIEDDKWKTSSLDLEEIYCTYLVRCGYNDMNVNTETEQDGGSIHKKTSMKEKGSDKRHNATADHSGAVGLSNETSKGNFVDNMVDESQLKSKGQKKCNNISDSLAHNEESSKVSKENIDNIMSESGDNETEKKHKHKRKKKEKRISDAPDGDVKKEQLETLQSDGFTKTDKKKKKKNKFSPESRDGNADKLLSLLIDANEESEEVSKRDGKTESKENKKRKRLLCVENKNQPTEKLATEGCKRRRIEGLPKSDVEQLTSADSFPIAEEGCDETGKFGHNELQEPSLVKLADGIEKSVERSSKKWHSGSDEPTSLKAFQRVKVSEVVYADKKLQDNSYWGKDGAEVGYGAKAQEILGKVKGRGFRHEKTKKKRGSYRGGLIDQQSHSVKFTYSDED